MYRSPYRGVMLCSSQVGRGALDGGWGGRACLSRSPWAALVIGIWRGGCGGVGTLGTLGKVVEVAR